MEGENGKHLRQSVALRPNNANAQYHYGEWLLDKKMYEEAEQAYKRVQQLAPTDSELFANAKRSEMQSTRQYRLS